MKSIAAMALLSSLLPHASWAEGAACNFPDQASSIPVVYFGGDQSKADQVARWAAAAQDNPDYAARFRFEAHPLHNPDLNLPDQSRQKAVLRGSRSDIESCVRRIDSPTFSGPVVLVGHSDGGLVINAIVSGVEKSNLKKISYVSLDGYAPKGEWLGQLGSMQCWTSYIQKTPGQVLTSCAEITDDIGSLSASEMKKCGPSSCHVLQEPGCRTRWCLHFGLINPRVPSNIGPSNYGQIGYDGLGDHASPPLQYLDSAIDPSAAY